MGDSMIIRKIAEPGRLVKEESLNFRSGYVELAPSESIGEHSTTAGEEILVVLEGEAMLECNGEKATAPAKSLVLIPPNSKHNVTNNAETQLRYVYIVSKQK